MDKHEKSIVIVGAGLAGLSAASHLVHNGYRNVTILEAQDRTGGRIHTAHFGDCPDSKVELGANWIHGAALNNQMITLANQMNLLDEWIPLNRMSGYCYTSDGKTISPQIVDRLWKLFQIWEMEETSIKYKSLSTRINLKDYLNQKLNSCIKTFSKEQHHFVRCAFNCMINYERFHQGGPLEEVPIPDVAGEDCDVPGGNIQVPAGLNAIIAGLQSNLPDDCIKLNQEVVKIIRPARGSTSSVIVQCKTGEEYHADHVVVTMPLGVLKYCHHSLFQPPLPHTKVEAMQCLSVGTVNKIFLKWNVPFWSKGRGGIKLAWSEEESAVLNYSLQWYKKIFAFDEVLNNSNVLVAWISGDEAKFIESLPDDEIIKVCIMVIRKFLNDPSIPEPVSVTHSNWCKNPFSRGSYSNITYKTTRNTFNDFASPIYYELPQVRKPAILFAGEATSNFGYSTMHGARRSGIREAQRLIECYKAGTKLSSSI